MDCSDNLATRYLLNDACAACGSIPLVSGSALRFEGQMTVYLTHRLPERRSLENEAKRQRLVDEERIPCFRCINPVPPPAVQACSDAGVLGVGMFLSFVIRSPTHLAVTLIFYAVLSPSYNIWECSSSITWLFRCSSWHYWNSSSSRSYKNTFGHRR